MRGGAVRLEATELPESWSLRQVLPHLFQHCTSDEEGVRNMVAECLGALTNMHPDWLVPELVKLTVDSEPLML